MCVACLDEDDYGGGLSAPRYSLVPQPELLAEQQKHDEAIANFKAKTAKCEKMLWSRKTAYAKQTCLNEANAANPEPTFFNTDIQEALSTANLQAALDYSEGKSSYQRFLLVKKENALKASLAYKAIVERREEAFRQEQMQQAQLEEMRRARMAQAIQQFGESMQRQQEINMMNRPRTTNCNAFGSQLSCTTW